MTLTSRGPPIHDEPAMPQCERAVMAQTELIKINKGGV
jgi:hypothetical protein